MRWIRSKKRHLCIYCKEPIWEGDVCIQSQAHYNLMWHEDCHFERFGDSWIHKPRNEKPE